MKHEKESDEIEIDVTPQKVSKKTKAVAEDFEKIMGEFLERTKREFDERLVIERQLLQQQTVADGPPPQVVISPQEALEGEHNFEVTPPIFGLQEGEQLGEHLVNILAVKSPKSALMLHMVTLLPNNLKIPLRVLVDTGYEMCLVRTGLIPPEFFMPARNKLSLVTANGSLLAGGQKECTLNLIANGFQTETNLCSFLELPTICMEANINVDLILSFGWFAERNIDICASQYGVRVNSQPAYFIPGAMVDVCAPMSNISAIQVANVCKIEICTLPRDATIKEVDPHILEGVKWDEDFRNCQCPTQSFVTPIVLPRHSDRMNVEQWEVFFSPVVLKNECPGWTEEEFLEIENLKKLRLRAMPEIEFEPEWDEATYEYIASFVLHPKFQSECQGVVGATDPAISSEAEAAKKRLLDRYAKDVFAPQLPHGFPSRGPNCEATIHLTPNAAPRNQRFFSNDR